MCIKLGMLIKLNLGRGPSECLMKGLPHVVSGPVRVQFIVYHEDYDVCGSLLRVLFS